MKKAQITIFMIVGIILLMGTGLILYSQFSTVDKRIEKVNIPTEFLPIDTYVSNCVKNVARKAIIEIGKNGGYIGLDEGSSKYTKTNFAIIDSLGPTDSEGVSFFGTDWKIPYWDYFKSSNLCKKNCKCDSKQPSLTNTDNSIEKQLERYLDENLKSCIHLDDLKGFDKIKEGNLKSDVTINEENVLVVLNLPIEAETQGDKLDMDYFSTKIPVRLKKVYDLATELTEYERNFSYLEKGALTVISSFASIDENKLPPLAASEYTPFQQQGKKWKKPEVKQKISDLLLTHVPLFTVIDSSNFKPRADIYALFSLPGENVDKEMSVSFSYLPIWPIYFDIHGRGVLGDTITSENAGSILFQFFGVHKYNFYYDVSYPVLVRIHDKKSFAGRGFDFYFALESNVRDNKELSCSGPAQGLPKLNYFSSGICKQSQKCLNISLDVKDSYTGDKLTDYILSYSCGNSACSVDQENDKFELPQCINAQLIVSKQGYSPKIITRSYFCDNSYSESVGLIKEKELEVSLKKKKIQKSPAGWSFDNSESGLYPNEEAIIVLNRISESAYEPSFTKTVKITAGVEPKVTLIPGKYDVTITLIYKLPDAFGNDVILIPEKKETVEGGFLQSDKSYTLPKIEFNDTFLAGQTFFNNETGYLEITEQELRNSNRIRFYALTLDQLTNLEQQDLAELGKFEQYSKENRFSLEPVMN